ncbi:hypothetical protein NQZ68_016019 [Dissostichus eleginoides]|nr:hypothetical protein NQZ68_016019 [Dissostichus eleginoides]
MIRLLVSPEEEVCCGLSKCQETAGQTPNGPQEGRRDPDPEAGSGSGPQLTSLSVCTHTLRGTTPDTHHAYLSGHMLPPYTGFYSCIRLKLSKGYSELLRLCSSLLLFLAERQKGLEEEVVP